MATKTPSTKKRSSKKGSKTADVKKKREAKAALHVSSIQPTWTGHGSEAQSASHHRAYRWLCNQNDQCVPYVEDDFTENINWRIFRIMAEFVEGFEFLSQLQREVTVFGSARLKSTNRYYKEARKLTRLCAKGEYTVITGGGPGIMEAANRGAFESGGDSIGLDISLPLEQRRNKYVNKSKGFHYFFTRKVMLSASAQAYVFFPGGFGTLDELFEMATLIETGKMSSEVPIILVGKDFWNPMLDWIKTQFVKELKTIDLKHFELLRLVDSAEDAYEIIAQTPERVL